MTFNLKLHLVEIKREEEEHSYSLADYAQFITLSYQVYKHLPEMLEGAGPAGPPYQTIKHNDQYLRSNFATIRREFAEGICEETNFKFKDITEELLAKMKKKREEKQLKYAQLEIAQKKTTQSILGLLSKIPTSAKVANLFEKCNEEKNQMMKINLSIQRDVQKSFEKEIKKLFWENADEIMEKMKSGRACQLSVLPPEMKV